MSTRTDTDHHLWPILFWLVLAMLVGALFIYGHHNAVQKSKLAEMKTALATATQHMAAVDTQLDKSTQAAKSAEAQIAELKAEHQQDIAALKAAHAETLDQLNAAHAEAVSKLKAEHQDALASLQQQHGEKLGQLEDQLAQAQQAAADQQQELTELRDTHATLTQELELQKASVSELNQRLAEISEDNHELKAKLSADNEAIAGLNFELNSANQVEAALRDKLERGASHQARLQELVDKEEAAILVLEEKLVKLAAERNALTEHADAAAKAAAGEPTQWQQELEQSQSLVAALQQELEAAVQDREAMQAQLGDAASASDPLAAELEQAKALIAKLQDDVAALKQTLDERDAALAEAKHAAADAAEHGNDAAALEAEVARLKSQLATIGAARDADETRIAELTQTVAGLEQKLATAEAAHAKAVADARAAGNASAAAVQGLYSNAAALGGQLTEDGILLSLAGDELQFASGTATLPDTELPSLDRIARFLKDNPTLTIRVEGHTDSSGSAEVNQDISQRRAEAVMQALIDRGVAAERISAAGRGEASPIADNATEAGRIANRRVEVYAIPQGD